MIDHVKNTTCAVSNTITTIDKETVAFCIDLLTLEEYPQLIQELINKFPQFLIYDGKTLWIKKEAECKISLDDLIDIAMHNPAFEIYDLENNKVLYPYTSNGSRFFDQEGNIIEL